MPTLLLLLLAACGPTRAAPAAADPAAADPAGAPAPSPSPTPSTSQGSSPSGAPDTLAAAFPPPPGATRAPSDAFGAWLGTLPLRPPGALVHSYEGDVIDIPAARVVAWDVSGQSALQCADMAIRLRATWERSVGRSPSFHYTSGHLTRWTDWAAGTRPQVSGSKVSFVRGAARPDSSDAAFAAWLKNVYTYAGSLSLGQDTVPVTSPRAGDLLVTPGSPGHVVTLLDLATDGEHTWVLVGQGFMPAMELHVLPGPDGGWFPVEGELLPSQPIAMPWANLRRWKEPPAG